MKKEELESILVIGAYDVIRGNMRYITGTGRDGQARQLWDRHW